MKQLDINEWQIILRCLEYIAQGKDIDEFEFHARIGNEREEIMEMIRNWQYLIGRDTSQDENTGINNCLGEICYGIFIPEANWQNVIKASEKEVVEIYKKWAKSQGYTHTGIM